MLELEPIHLDSNLVAPSPVRHGETSRLVDFEVIAPIARGALGGVYLALDRRTGERVAIKMLDARYAKHEELVRRLLAEREVSDRVHHPNLVEVKSAGCGGTGVPYLVIELLDGESLGERAERGRMAIAAIVEIAGQIATGLAALHDAGIAHCDVKPDNIVVLDGQGTGAPVVKVIDYGLALVVAEIRPSDPTTSGTPASMAPEQWFGTPTFTSDVYALGCLVFELLTGETVFAGTLPELRVAHTTHVPRRASSLRDDVPPELDHLLMRTMVKDPAMRPTMREVAGTLRELATG